ncbi:MAG TPA: type I secretion system permease/ATPase [Gammaproteobacteria bacterium]|nr:type I secretion system permease/ATPase [Gammaproteobacteria bacterium]
MTPAEQSAAQRAPADEIRSVLARCRQSLVAVGVFSAGINVLFLVPAVYMLQVYDRVLTSHSEATLLMLTLIVLFLLGTLGALEWVRTQIMVRVSQRIDALLADRLFELSFRQALASGGVQSGAQPLQDLQGLRQFVTGSGLFAFFDAPWMPLYLLVMFAMHPLYGWLGVFAALALLGISIANERSTAALLKSANQDAVANQALLARTLRNAEAIEALGMLGQLHQRWKTRSEGVLETQSRASAKGGRWVTLSRWLRLTLQSLALGLGAYLALENEISSGMLIAGAILLGRALYPIDQLTGVWKQFIGVREQYRRLNEWLRRIPSQPARMSLPAPTGRVSVEAITVVPPGAQLPALRSVSFEIAAGEIVGVIGPSAAGKTTLARTLLGIWPATQGKVRLDGADVFGWSRAELGPHLGYLPQDVELFDGTIADNIARFGERDGEKVVAAARLAGVHEMVLKFPQGYDTVIGASAGILTGGQRQRIALARALYGEPKLIVLDEPNSSLDEAGDSALLAALLALKARRATVVVISHRTGVLPAIDKLLVLKDGQMGAFGPRDEVRKKMQPAPQATALHAAGGASGTSQVLPLRPATPPESQS